MERTSRDDTTDMTRIDYQKIAQLRETRKNAELDYYLKTYKTGYIEDERHSGYFWYTQRRSCFGDTSVLKMAKNYFLPEHPFNQCQFQLDMMTLRFLIIVLFCPLTGDTRLFIRARTNDEANRLACNFNEFAVGLTKNRRIVHHAPPFLDSLVIPINLVDTYEEHRDETFLGLFDSEDNIFYFWKPKSSNYSTNNLNDSVDISRYIYAERKNQDEFESHRIPDAPVNDEE